LGWQAFCFIRDAEEWGKNQFQPDEMMRLTFDEIDHSDLVIADVADWPIGVGVEVGYAYAKGIPILCICPVAKPVANTVAGLARWVCKYGSYDDLTNKLNSIDFPPQPAEYQR